MPDKKVYTTKDKNGRDVRVIKRSDDGFDWYEQAVDIFGNNFYKHLYWLKELPIDVVFVEIEV